MAYATSNPPKAIAAGIGGGNTTWRYASADAHATVSGAGYFSNGDALGMKVGDIVFVQNTTGYTTTLHSVSAVTAGGAATVSAAVLA